MQKKYIGLYSDYDTSEQSLAAMFLAEYLPRLYRKVVWVVPHKLTSESRFYGFSPRWDKETVPKENCLNKLKDCETFLFFKPDEDICNQLPENSIKILVLNPFRQKESQSEFAAKCSINLVTSLSFIPLVKQPGSGTKLTLWAYEPSCQLFPRQEAGTGKYLNAVYPAFGMTAAERQRVHSIASIVKECLGSKIRSVVICYDNNIKASAGFDTKCTDWKMREYIKYSDWVIDLNPHPVYGVYSSLAAAVHSQWSGFDMPPNTDEYSAARRHLIEGDLLNTEPASAAQQIVRHFLQYLSGGLDKEADAGSHYKRCQQFAESTNRIFNIAANLKHQ